MRIFHLRAILQALLVTFIWSLSWVLIKIGLAEIPALVFAGLRYSMAAVVLLILAFFRPEVAHDIRQLDKSDWPGLILLGLIFYAVTQGAQFLALDYLPAVTLSLMLNFTTVVVALMGSYFLKERPNKQQWTGIVLFVFGALIYFGPVELPERQIIGLLIGFAALVANASSSVLGRSINRNQKLSPLSVTVISMSVGSAILLATGLLTQGFPALSVANWFLIGWLAIVHTAFTFTLWNHTLRTLSAVESSIINSTMLVQIAILAWLFLGESVTFIASIGLVLVVIGTLVVQLAAPRQSQR